MSERIPLHEFPVESTHVPALKIFQFKDATDAHASLPITPLPTNAPHRHSYFEVLFVEEGQGFHEIDFQTYPFEGAGLHFLTPGQVHLLNFTSRCSGFIVAFSEAFFSFYNPQSQALAQYVFFRPERRSQVLALSEPERRYFRNLTENMVADHLAAEAEPLMTGHYLNLILQKSASLFQQNQAQIPASFSASGLVNEFQEKVDKNYREQHSVKYYAKLLNVSPDYLSKSVKKQLNVSAGDYILTRLLLEAKRLLVFTPMSSKEVAYALHMEDPSYFGRLFKNKTGLTPNQYRRTVRKSTIN